MEEQAPLHLGLEMTGGTNTINLHVHVHRCSSTLLCVHAHWRYSSIMAAIFKRRDTCRDSKFQLARAHAVGKLI